MTNEIEENQNEEQEEKLTCPECGKGFQDMRGLTSHARHSHDINKDEVSEMIDEKNQDYNSWKVIGALSTFIITIITLGKMR